jgi:hypothetical protein
MAAGAATGPDSDAGGAGRTAVVMAD